MYYVWDREVLAEKEGFVVWRLNGWILVSSLPSSEQLDTALLLSYFPN